MYLYLHIQGYVNLPIQSLFIFLYLSKKIKMHQNTFSFCRQYNKYVLLFLEQTLLIFQSNNVLVENAVIPEKSIRSKDRESQFLYETYKWKTLYRYRTWHDLCFAPSRISLSLLTKLRFMQRS